MTEGQSTTNAKTTRFFPALDVALLREVVASQHSKLCWDTVHKNVNESLTKLKRHTFVTQRACKDRLKTLQDAHKKQEMTSLRASGTDEEYSERSSLLTELANLEEEKAKEKEKAVDTKEAQGKIIRRAAMESLKRASNEMVETDGADSDGNKEKPGEEDSTSSILPAKKRRGDAATSEYVGYMKEKLELEKERFDLEKKEREARLQNERHMLLLMKSLIDKNT